MTFNDASLLEAQLLTHLLKKLLQILRRESTMVHNSIPPPNSLYQAYFLKYFFGELFISAQQSIHTHVKVLQFCTKVYSLIHHRTTNTATLPQRKLHPLHCNPSTPPNEKWLGIKGKESRDSDHERADRYVQFI